MTVFGVVVEFTHYHTMNFSPRHQVQNGGKPDKRLLLPIPIVQKFCIIRTRQFIRRCPDEPWDGLSLSLVG